MDSGLIRCSNCEEELPEDQFSDIQLAGDSICDMCLDDMVDAEEEDENAVAEESEDDFTD